MDSRIVKSSLLGTRAESPFRVKMDTKQPGEAPTRPSAPKLPHFPARKAQSTSAAKSPAKGSRNEHLPGMHVVTPAAASGGRGGGTGIDKLAHLARHGDTTTGWAAAKGADAGAAGTAGFESPKLGLTRAQVARDEVLAYMQRRRQQQSGRSGSGEAGPRDTFDDDCGPPNGKTSGPRGTQAHAGVSSSPSPDESTEDFMDAYRCRLAAGGAANGGMIGGSGDVELGIGVLTAHGVEPFAADWPGGSGSGGGGGGQFRDDDLAGGSGADQSPTSHVPPHGGRRPLSSALTAAAHAAGAAVGCRSGGSGSGRTVERLSLPMAAAVALPLAGGAAAALTEDAFELFKRDIAARVVQAHWRRWQAWKAQVRREAEARILQQLLADNMSSLDLRLLLAARDGKEDGNRSRKSTGGHGSRTNGAGGGGSGEGSSGSGDGSRGGRRVRASALVMETETERMKDLQEAAAPAHGLALSFVSGAGDCSRKSHRPQLSGGNALSNIAAVGASAAAAASLSTAGTPRKSAAGAPASRGIAAGPAAAVSNSRSGTPKRPSSAVEADALPGGGSGGDSGIPAGDQGRVRPRTAGATTAAPPTRNEPRVIAQSAVYVRGGGDGGGGGGSGRSSGDSGGNGSSRSTAGTALHTNLYDAADRQDDYIIDGDEDGNDWDKDDFSENGGVNPHKLLATPRKAHAGGHAVYTFVATPRRQARTAPAAAVAAAGAAGASEGGVAVGGAAAVMEAKAPRGGNSAAAGPGVEEAAARSSSQVPQQEQQQQQPPYHHSTQQLQLRQPSLDADSNPAMASPALSAVTGGGDGGGGDEASPPATSGLDAESRMAPERGQRQQQQHRREQERGRGVGVGHEDEREREQDCDRLQDQQQAQKQQRAQHGSSKSSASAAASRMGGTQVEPPMSLPAQQHRQQHQQHQQPLRPPSPQRPAGGTEALQRLKQQGSQRASILAGSTKSTSASVNLKPEASGSGFLQELSQQRGGEAAPAASAGPARSLGSARSEGQSGGAEQQQHQREPQRSQQQPQQRLHEELRREESGRGWRKGRRADDGEGKEDDGGQEAEERRQRRHSHVNAHEGLQQQYEDDQGYKHPRRHERQQEQSRQQQDRQHCPQPQRRHAAHDPQPHQHQIHPHYQQQSEVLEASLRGMGEHGSGAAAPHAPPQLPQYRKQQDQGEQREQRERHQYRPQQQQHHQQLHGHGDREECPRPLSAPVAPPAGESGQDASRGAGGGSRGSGGGHEVGQSLTAVTRPASACASIQPSRPQQQQQFQHHRQARPSQELLSPLHGGSGWANSWGQRGYSSSGSFSESEFGEDEDELQQDKGLGVVQEAWTDKTFGTKRRNAGAGVAGGVGDCGGRSRNVPPGHQVLAATQAAVIQQQEQQYQEQQRRPSAPPAIAPAHSGGPPAPAAAAPAAGGGDGGEVVAASLIAEKMTSILRYLDEVEVQAEQEAACAAMAPSLLLAEPSAAAAFAAAAALLARHDGARPATASAASSRHGAAGSLCQTCTTGGSQLAMQRSMGAFSESAAAARHIATSRCHSQSCGGTQASGRNGGTGDSTVAAGCHDRMEGEGDEGEEDDGVSVGLASAISGRTNRPAFLAESVYESVRAKIHQLQEDVRERDDRIEELCQEVEALVAAQRVAAREADSRLTELLSAQRSEFEGAVGRHLAFVDRLLADKEVLGGRVEALEAQVKAADERQDRAIAKLKEGWAAELRRQKEGWAAAERQRREAWMAAKATEIKDVTVKGLEGEVQKLLSRHKGELAAAQQAAADEARRHLDAYVGQNEAAVRQLKERLAREAEESVERERAAAATRLREVSERYEQQLQTQRMRLVSDADLRLEQLEQARKEERKRHEEVLAAAHEAGGARQREAGEDWKREKEALRKAHDKQIEALREQYETGQDGWRAAMAERAKQEVAERVAAIRDKLLGERNEEVQAVLGRLESEHGAATEALKEEGRRREEAAVARAAAALKEAKRGEAKMAERFRSAGAAAQAAEGRLAASELAALELRRELEGRNSAIRWLESQVNGAKEEASARERDLRSLGADKAAVAAEVAAAEAGRRQAVEARLAAALQESSELRSRHGAEMAHVEGRVKATLARKDEVIGGLREQLAVLAAELRSTQEVLRMQQEELGQ